MAERVTAPKGTYDILPERQPLWRLVAETGAEVFQTYGYGRIDTPMFEETRLFARGVGEATDIVRKEMYTFEDMGGRSMTLRPEGTAPVARAFLEHGMHTRAQPVKLWYYAPMFRYENPQSGRYRQHFQLGVEAFGSTSPALDAEVIGMLGALYARLGLGELDLLLNSMGCRECRPEYQKRLRAFLEEWSDSLCRECRERAQANPLRTFDCKVDECRRILEDAPRLLDDLCPACAEHHQAVRTHLGAQGLEYREDHRLVRGMDYYTRTTFEFQSHALGAQAGIGGGGRYDDLIEAIGGPSVPGVGFGTGMERIIMALERTRDELPHDRGPQAYVVALDPPAREEGFALAAELRGAGIPTDLDFMGRSTKGQMKQAGKSGAGWALILGADERERGIVTVRDLAEGTEEGVSRNQVVAMIVEEGKKRS